MALHPADAERVLRARLGNPINPVPRGERAGRDNDKVLGFASSSGRVLALNRKIDGETHIWFEPNAEPELDGVRRRPKAAINDNLSGRLAVLNDRRGLQVEVDSEEALHRFLDWYAGSALAQLPHARALHPVTFHEAFARFQRLIAANDRGHAFTNFNEGVAAVWESYKPRLREHARGILKADAWRQAEIGSGSILQRVIGAIEIQDSHIKLTNNLVFWQNRFGHANRDHHALLDGQANAGLRQELERLLFGLYRGEADEGAMFNALSKLTGGKYPLLAYLYFLKDMDRFMPIQPTTFDRVFRDLGIGLVTLRNCSWENYQRYNEALVEVRKALGTIDGLSQVRLVDAHSFCWMLEKLDEDPGEPGNTGRTDTGRVLGGRDVSIMQMRDSVLQTVKNSNGQTVERSVKNKELRMSPLALEEHIRALMDLQGNRCALTGIPLEFHGSNADPNLAPSLDRIDSDGHYEAGNLQVVCRFVNFWKGASDDEEFKGLLMLVRGVPVD